MKKIVIVIICFFLVFCTQTDTNSSSLSGDLEINNIFDTLKTTYEIYEVSLQNNIIRTNSGIELHFDASTFESSKIIVKFKYVNSIKDIIFNNLSTQDLDSNLLTSKGMMYISYLDSNLNVVYPKKKVKVHCPVSFSSDYKLFKGKENEEERIVWGLMEEDILIDSFKVEKSKKEFYDIIMTGSEERGFVFDTVYTTNEQIVLRDTLFSVFNTNQVGWFNFDKYLNFDELTDVVVNVNDKDIPTLFVLIYKNYNSVVFKNAYKKNKIRFNRVPINEAVSIVSLQMINSDIKYSIIDFTTNTKEINMPLFKSTTLEELETELLQKFGEDFSLNE